MANGLIQVRPPVVVFEPDWVIEILHSRPANTTNATALPGYFETVLVSDPRLNPSPSDANSTAVARYMYWQPALWRRLLEELQAVLKLFPHSWVYLDFGNVAYIEDVMPWMLDLLLPDLLPLTRGASASQGAHSPFLRGLACNVANFHSTNATMATMDRLLGRFQQAANVTDLNLSVLIDTSRNGGLFSQRSVQQIDSCKFDPPNIKAGSEPMWSDVAYASSSADQIGSATELHSQSEWVDGFAWLKPLGEADGRLYPAGEYHECLIEHQIECDDTCPENERVALPQCRCG